MLLQVEKDQEDQRLEAVRRLRTLEMGGGASEEVITRSILFLSSEPLGQRQDRSVWGFLRECQSSLGGHKALRSNSNVFGGYT